MKRIIKLMMVCSLLACFSTLQADVTEPECEAEQAPQGGAVGVRNPCKKAEVADVSSEVEGEGNTLSSDDSKKDKKKKKKDKKDKKDKENKEKQAQKDQEKHDEKDKKD